MAWQAQGNQAVEEVNTQLNRQVIQESLLRFGLRPCGKVACCLPSGQWGVVTDHGCVAFVGISIMSVANATAAF